MTESERPRLLNVGGNDVEKAIYIEPESAAIERLAELRDNGKFNISELPTVSLDFLFESTLLSNKLDILEFILDSNPLNATNRQIYKVFLNKKPPFPTAISILNRAIIRQKVTLIQKLIAYGADVNEVHSNGMKPLDYTSSTTAEIYNILKNAGATSAGPAFFTAKAKYSIFLIHFADVDLKTQVIFSLFSIDDKILPHLVYDKDIPMIEPLLLHLFQYTTGAKYNEVHLGRPAPKVLNSLWDLYKAIHRFDYAFEYTAPKIPMFSQKGTTCASDATFTVLFQSPKLAPLWSAIDFSSVPNNNTYTVFDYKDMFQAAKIRHERLAGRNFSRGPFRRQESVGNNVWKGMHEQIACPVSGGIPHSNSVKFLTDIFELNKLQIPALQTRPFSVIPTDSTHTFASTRTDLSRIVAVLVQADQVDKRESHMYGLFRNETGGWMLADNEVGFIHTFQDNYWVENTFLPRLDLTIETPTVSNLDEKVLIYLRAMDEIDLHAQFITLGSKFYPNIDTPCVFTDLNNLSIPVRAIYIVENPPAVNPYAVSTGVAWNPLSPYGPVYNAGLMAYNMSNLARRLEALRSHHRAVEPPVNFNARLRALRGDFGTKEGGRRKTRRHSHRRSKTISRRK